MSTRRGFLGTLVAWLGMGATVKAAQSSECIPLLDLSQGTFTIEEGPGLEIKPMPVEAVLRDKSLGERLPEGVFMEIHEAIGMASMCWTNPCGAGVFDSIRAANIAFNLCHFVADEIDKAKTSR